MTDPRYPYGNMYDDGTPNQDDLFDKVLPPPPGAEEVEILDDTVIYAITPGPNFMADAIVEDSVIWGALADRITEDVGDHELTVEDAILIWDHGMRGFLLSDEF